jgi:hypothetical protein
MQTKLQPLSDACDPRLAEAIAHNAETGGSRWIEYDGVLMLVPLQALRHTVDYLKASDRREIVMTSVNAALACGFPSVKAGTASQDDAVGCAQDVVIWFANEVIAGRASLEVS